MALIAEHHRFNELTFTIHYSHFVPKVTK